MEIDLTIIVVAWNVKELLVDCFDALRKSEDNYSKQIILVDNGSEDGTAEFVKNYYPEVELIESETNLGFIRANNLAYEKAKGRDILMLNSDAYVFPDSIAKTMEYLHSSDDIGVVGPRLIRRSGLQINSARYFPTPFKLFLRSIGMDGKFPFVKPLDDLEYDHQSIKECDWVVGCYLLTRKELIDRTGFFLREDYFMYNDDNDICLRIKRMGYKVFCYPVDVIHDGGANMKKMKIEGTLNSFSKQLQLESQFIYFRKNYGAITAWNSYWFSVFSAMINSSKRLFFKKGDYLVKEYYTQIVHLTRIFIKTKMGKTAIN